MKILFICGSLESGRDGVGDYTRRLGIEVQKQGHKVFLMSIYDQYVTQQIESTYTQEDELNIPVLRISSKLRSKNRIAKARQYINNFDPNWISLQFVPYSFQKKGLPYKLASILKGIIGEAKFHIMFHELWVGWEPDAIVKYKILGAIQKIFIKLLVASLQPAKVFTNNQFYATKLNQIEIMSELAPVFGNIPLEDFGSDDEWNELVSATSLSKLSLNQDKWLVLGFFGTVYPCVGLHQLLLQASVAAKQSGRQLGILSIGHGRAWDICAMAQDLPEVSCWKTGKISPGMINRTMQLVDIAVITTLPAVVNKSGTASSWLERGIPVLLAAMDETYCKKEMEPQGFFHAKNVDDILLIAEAKNRFSLPNRLEEVAKSYSLLELSGSETVASSN